MSKTLNWPKMFFHPQQFKLITSEKKYQCVVAGRGSGKTELARRKIVMALLERKPWPNPMYFYMLPTADQARRVAWNPILDLIPENLIARKHENTMKLVTIFGSELHCLSGEKPERAEGVQWDGGVLDESSDLKRGIFTKNLGPATTHRKAWVWRIGVPKSAGIGAMEFKEFYERGLNGDPNIDSHHWVSADILSPEELEIKRRDMTPQDFREQYEATWENASGLVFPDFHESIHCSTQVQYNSNQPIFVGSDFNVDPMSWVLCHYIDNKVLVFDELFIRNTTTQRTLDELHKRYGKHMAGWFFIGDASSRARKTSASQSDYIQINNDMRFAHKKMLYPKINPAVADRVYCANVTIMDANNVSHILINPKCNNLIRDLKFRYYAEGTSQIEDTEDLGHITDALSYAIWQLRPIQITQRINSKVIIQ